MFLAKEQMRKSLMLRNPELVLPLNQSICSAAEWIQWFSTSFGPIEKSAATHEKQKHAFKHGIKNNNITTT